MDDHIYFLLPRNHWLVHRIMTKDAKDDVLVAEAWALKELCLEKLGFFLRVAMCLSWATMREWYGERLPFYTQFPRRLTLLSSCHYWNSSWTWILLFIKYIMTTLQFLPVYKATSVCKTSTYVKMRLKWLTLNVNCIICQKI